MTADTTLLPVVTDDEAATINAARDALNAIKERAQYLAGDPPAGPDGWIEARSQDYGRLIGYATVTANLLFDTLNVAHAFCNAPLTDAQLHNREEA